MNFNMLISGFGGQGVVLIGQMIGRAAMAAGKNATFYPSYGPEQRGGTASCSVVISDAEIGSPVASRPNVLVCFNTAALEKFGPFLQKGGLLIANSSQIKERDCPQTDFDIIRIPINNLAEEIGSPKVANIIMMGAVIKKTGAFPIEYAEKVVLEKLKSKPDLLELNKKALCCGAALV